ncbi:phasin family protein [Sedimentitalea sp. JM2-8]|uniref:Phasin family protein n=1 Tax=Sedimentitalea xiamensis TaxID=3050037 RepID=A0ABT7FAL6_9RHOB|nr:phasin family protein [Sedimentitalea xiamensis]MDK3072141.1 phasin family protein [Sedimentitalea xiamensis]
MTKSKPKTTQDNGGAAEFASAMMAINPKAMEAWVEIMNDSASFVADRFQKDLATQKALLACRAPSELMRIQSEFVRDAVEQYTAQTTRMFEKISKAAGKSIKDTTAGQSRDYDDIPL